MISSTARVIFCFIPGLLKIVDVENKSVEVSMPRFSWTCLSTNPEFCLRYCTSSERSLFLICNTDLAYSHHNVVGIVSID